MNLSKEQKVINSMQPQPPFPGPIYEGEFTNEQGICNIFHFHYITMQGILSRQNRSGINCHYSVLEGVPIGIELNAHEQLWLRACWATAQRISQPGNTKPLICLPQGWTPQRLPRRQNGPRWKALREKPGTRAQAWWKARKLLDAPSSEL